MNEMDDTLSLFTCACVESPRSQVAGDLATELVKLRVTKAWECINAFSMFTKFKNYVKIPLCVF